MNRIKAALARSRSEGSVLRTFASPTAVLGVIGSLAAWALLSISPAVAQGPTCAGLAVTMSGGTSGNDLIVGTDGNDVINALGGNDTIEGRLGNDTICGGDGEDFILGEDGNDLILGGPGPDLIRGNAGDDRIRAEAGNDLASGGEGIDDVRGQGGDDRLAGGPASDIILGGPGNDVISGGDGNDTIRGGDGDDTLVVGGTVGVGSGADILRGEGGSDLLFAIDRTPDDNLDGGPGDNDCVFDEGDQVTGTCANPLTAAQGNLILQCVQEFEETGPNQRQREATRRSWDGIGAAEEP